MFDINTGMLVSKLKDYLDYQVLPFQTYLEAMKYETFNQLKQYLSNFEDPDYILLFAKEKTLCIQFVRYQLSFFFG